MKKLIIRIDDVHPRMNWGNFKYITSELLSKGQTALLGVIPDCKDPKLQFGSYQDDFWDYIRFLRSNGFVIAQHGYQHLYDTRGRSILVGEDQSEFSTHDYNTQFTKLDLGKNILIKENLSTDVFMAPGHHFDDITLKALSDAGFNYITDGYAFFPFRSKTSNLIYVPQLIARPHGTIFGVYTTCCHIDHMKITDIDEFLQKTNGYHIVSFSEASTMLHPIGTELLSKTVAEFLINVKRNFGRIKKKLLVS